MTFDNKRLYDDILSFLSVKYPKYVIKTPLGKTVEINKKHCRWPGAWRQLDTSYRYPRIRQLTLSGQAAYPLIYQRDTQVRTL